MGTAMTDPITPWTTEGDEDDAPWFDPPEPEPVPTITKVAYLIPVTQQMLDGIPNPNIADLFNRQWQMAELHRGQYHPHRLDYQRIQLQEMRQQRRRQTLRTFIPKSRRRPGARMTPGTWQPAPQPMLVILDEMRYSWSPDGQESLRVASDYEPSCCAYCGTTADCDCEQIEDLPGVWASDDEDEQTDV